MPNILLRDILEAGFCGSYNAKGRTRTIGKTRYALDELAATGKFDGFDQEGVQIQLANQKFIPYEDNQFFSKCLAGLLNNGTYFNPTDHEWIHDSIKLEGTEYEIQFIAIKDKSCGAIIEPVYDFVSFQNYLPMHSLITAYLMGLQKVQIDPISLMAGPIEPKMWTVDRPAIFSLLVQWVSSVTNPEHRKASGACMSCSQAGCSWKSSFDGRVYDWMKAKQKLQELEAEIKEHVTYNGPTKVGAHMVYMKENKRRSLEPNKRDEFLKLLQEKRPHDWVNFMHPDAAEIFKMAAKGTLPKEIVNGFKESRFYTLDTTLTL